MALLSNVPTLSYIRWQNLLIIYKDEVYQIYNNHTNKPFIYFDAINSPNELIMSNKKLEERDGLFYIIFNDNGKYIIVPQTEIEINFSENGSVDAVSSKILGFKEQLNEQSQKVVTIETDVEGIKTTVNQFEESITKNETSISTLEQRANEIDAEVEKITMDFSDDIVIRELRENTTMAILSIQSTLGLFSSDMNTYMKDNKLSSAETDEINAYKENLNNELTLMNLQTDNVIDLLNDKGEVEKVTRLNTAIEKLNTAINNLYTNIDTCSIDNVFTNNEIATIISYFGKANVAINELKNLIDECIYLSLGGRLVEEIGKIIVKQDQIQLSVSKNENSIRSTLSKEMSLVQDVVDENIVSLNNFRNCLNTISTDGAFTSDEIDVITTRANDLDVNFDKMTSKKSEIEGNTLLSDEQKEEIDKSYTNYKTSHNNLLSNINTIVTDGLMTTEEMISINEEIENYRNEINNMNTVLFSSLEEINKNGIITDINNVDEKWAEIILDPENGIQSQVGDIQKQINDGGGIIERLNTAEQKITADAIINTVSSTYYSKEEVDNKLEDVDIGLVVESIDVMYYLSNSATELSGGSWSTTAPTLQNGKYIWSKTVTTFTDDTTKETEPVCITGGKDGQTLYTWIKYSDNEDGSNMYDTPSDNTLYIGIATNKESETESSNPSDYTWSKFRGVDGNSYYTWIRYADDKDGNGISDNPTDKLYIGFAYNKSSNIESNNPSDYMWSLIKGTDGVDGEKGKDGINYYTWIKYSDNEDGSNMYDIPTDNTKYIGIAVNKTTPTESNVVSDYKWSKFRGDDGVDGTDGKGIVTVVDYYKVHASDIGVTNATSGFSTDVPQMDATNKYLWSYELITYTDNSTTKTNARVIGVYGENGTDGKGISSIVEYYAVNNSSTTVPTSFETTIPTMNATNRFLWNYEVINFTDGSEKTTDKRIIGVYGETGEAGKGISSIVEQYYLSTSKVSQTDGSWVDSPPTWVEGKYMWTRSKITYSDNSIEYTTPICDNTWENISDLQNQVNNNKTEIETTKATVASHTTSLNSITSRVETNESNITTVDGKVTNMENRVSSAEQKITDKAITSVVQESQFIKDMDGKISTNKSNISKVEQTVDSWKVEIGNKADSSNIISIINASTEGITISSSKVNISGFVTFSDLSTSGRTTINGGNITTGYVKGTRIDAKNLTVKTNSGINTLMIDSNGQVELRPKSMTVSTDDKITFLASNNYRNMLLYGGQVCVYNNMNDSFMATIGHVLRSSNSTYRGVGVLAGKGCNTFFIGRDSTWGDILTNRSPNPLGSFFINFESITAQTDGVKGIHLREITYTNSDLIAIGDTRPSISGFKNISCTNSMFDNWKSVVDESIIMKYDGAHNIYLGKNLNGNGFIASGFKDIICTNSMFSYWKSITDESTIMRYDGYSNIYLGKNLYGNGFTATGFSTMTASQFTVSNSSNLRIARGVLYDPKNGSVSRDYVKLDGTYLKGGTSEICFIRASDADWANIYAGTIYSKQTAVTSDMNLKTDIRYVNIDPQTISESSGLMAPNVNITTEDMHEFIETLPMVSYRMKDDVKNGIDDTYYGFLAQEVLYTKVGSELIKIEETTNEKGETNESYRYSENKFASFIAGALQEEIKERKEEIENLNNTIISLEERIKDLEDKLNK